jgi:hypothetical protein
VAFVDTKLKNLNKNSLLVAALESLNLHVLSKLSEITRLRQFSDGDFKIYVLCGVINLHYRYVYDMYMRVVFTDLTPYAEGPNLKIPQIHHAF